MRYNDTGDFPIIDKYWYVVEFKNLIKLKLLPYYFLNANAAKRAIKDNFDKSRWKFVEVMRGKKLRSHLVKYDMSNGLGKFTKYDYPKDKTEIQERKSHRTKMRRRLRRMGLFTLVKTKKSVRDSPDIIKAIVNKQKVANTKNTAAQVIQIERKPKYYYYLILTKERATKKGKLFRLNCIKFDKRNGSMKHTVLHILRTDVLIPYLITHLENMVYEEIQKEQGDKAKRKRIAYYQKYGLRVHAIPSEPKGSV